MAIAFYIGLMMVHVNVSGGSVVLAHGVHACWIFHHGNVGGVTLVRERGCALPLPYTHVVLHELFWAVEDEGLGIWGVLNEEEPVVIAFRELEIGLAVHGEGGCDVEEHCFANFLWVVDAQPVGYSCPSVMSTYVVCLVAELLHDLHAIPCHSSLAVYLMWLIARWFRGSAIASEVDHYDREYLIKTICQVVPDEMVLGEPVMSSDIDGWWSQVAGTPMKQ